MKFAKHRVVPAALAVAAAAALSSAAAAATVPATKPTSAATLKGVVVARERARGTLVVASAHGAVRTVRTHATLRAGARVTARVTRLADGTYRASSVRARGTGRQARVHGVVVTITAGRLVLSAGGSVFSVRRLRTLSARGGDGGAQPGDVVDATLSIDLESGDVGESSLQQVGQTDLVSLEGTISSVAADTLVLAVEEGAVTTITIPPSLTVPPEISVGDRVEVLAQVSAGTFTLVSIQDDHAAAQSGSGASSTESGQSQVEAEGIVSGVDAGSLTVQPEHGSAITLTVPNGFDVSGVQVGDRVHAKGALQPDGSIILVRLELQGSAEGAQHSGRVEAEGPVTALGAGTITIQPEEGAPVVFTVPAGFDLSGVAVGDTVEAKGTSNADGSVTLTALELKGGDGASGGGDSAGGQSGGGDSGGGGSGGDGGGD